MPEEEKQIQKQSKPVSAPPMEQMRPPPIPPPPYEFKSEIPHISEQDL
jgi:hypothetical protein